MAQARHHRSGTAHGSRTAHRPYEPALRDVSPTSVWLDNPLAPEPTAPLTGDESCDLAVVGAGFSGLWTALLAKERDPSRDVVLLDAGTVAHAASGRNGGFVSASLTHGLANGDRHFPGEVGDLIALGQENLDAIAATVERLGIDCGFERTGELTVATAPWQLADLAEAAARSSELGIPVKELDADATRAELDSPTYLGGLAQPGDTALVDPARLAWGLAAACRSAGVRMHENTRVVGLRPTATGVAVRTAHGTLTSRRVALATSATPLLPAVRRRVVPVWDHVLATEPLSAEQLGRIGWSARQGVSDAGNQFHYYRLTPDNRILWGGYDALYHFGGDVSEARAQSPRTQALLAAHFADTFPQLEDVAFTHAWGGVIDTCTRFCPFWGTTARGRIAYVAGYTGLGVGASRFGANVLLDLLDEVPSERTRLRLTTTRPVPFPPEPLRWTGITLTRWSLAHADRHEGRRNPWLRALDAAGVGFDS